MADYPYTRDRSRFDSAMTMLTAMIAVESIVLVVLILIFAKAWWLRGTLLGVYGVALLAARHWLRAPLRTAHTLNDEALELRYGADSLRVPREAIAEVTSTQARVEPFLTMRGTFEPRRQQLQLAFSEQGQVRLTLHEPQAIRWNGAAGEVADILFNVDDREALLAALGESTPPPVAVEPCVEKRHLNRVPIATHSGHERLRIEGLTRRFGERVAVDALSLTLPPGEIYGFLGENGAGKSTTLKMLVGLLAPTAGRIWIEGHDLWQQPASAKLTLGYVPDRALLYERLSGREYLKFIAQLRGLPQRSSEARSALLLDSLGLTEAAERPCGSYSLGMRRRLSVAAALLHEPSLLILDEPLNGLDPRVTRQLKQMLRELAANGTTILLSTHDLAAAESLCDRVGVIHRGRLIAEGSIESLRRGDAATPLETIFFDLTAQEVA